MMKTKKLTAVLLVTGLMGISGCGAVDDIQKQASEQMEWADEHNARDNGMSATEAFEKEFGDLSSSEDENVLLVKNGTNSNYPTVTYGEAFDEFFENPSWRYFTGTQDGPDDDGDGEPDYTKDDVDVIEFTGKCMYSDVKVKALIQFTLDKDAGTFDIAYLSFNEVPQSTLVLSGLLSSVFESYLEEHVYPEGMNYYKDEMNPMTVAGNYGGALGQSAADISIYSSPEDTKIGNATIYLDSEIEDFGGNEYSGELTKLDSNVYSLENSDNQTILLAMNYDEDNDTISFELWIDNKLVENYYMLEHYES